MFIEYLNILWFLSEQDTCLDKYFVHILLKNKCFDFFTDPT